MRVKPAMTESCGRLTRRGNHKTPLVSPCAVIPGLTRDPCSSRKALAMNFVGEIGRVRGHGLRVKPAMTAGWAWLTKRGNH